MPSKGTSILSVRIKDESIEELKRTAEKNGTTVAKMINGYAQSLNRSPWCDRFSIIGLYNYCPICGRKLNEQETNRTSQGNSPTE